MIKSFSLFLFIVQLFWGGHLSCSEALPLDECFKLGPLFRSGTNISPNTAVMLMNLSVSRFDFRFPESANISKLKPRPITEANGNHEGEPQPILSKEM